LESISPAGEDTFSDRDRFINRTSVMYRLTRKSSLTGLEAGTGTDAEAAEQGESKTGRTDS
jgi:hypothetical protein